MTNNPPPLSADAGELRRFIDALFCHASPGGFVSLRAFYDAKDGAFGAAVAVPIGDDLNELSSKAEEMANRCARYREPVVFAPPICAFADGGSAKEKNLSEVLCLSVECDRRPAEAVAALAAILGPPTIVMASGGFWSDPETGEVQDKLHAHWRLSEVAADAEDRDKAYQAREIMAALVGSDHTSINAVHPMRWAGSWHRKNPGSPRLARIVEENKAAEVHLADALESMQEVAKLRGVDGHRKRKPAAGAVPPVLDATRAENAEDAIAAFDVLPNSDLEWSEWNRRAMALHYATGGSEAGREAFHRWSERSWKYDRSVTDERWDHLHSSPPDGRIGFGSIIRWAREQDRAWISPSFQAKREARAKKRSEIAYAASQPKPNGRDTSAAPPSPAEARPQALPELAAKAAEGTEIGPGKPAGESQAPSALGEVDAGEDDDEIEPRQWLLGTLFCKTFVSALIGEGGTGKSALRLVQLLSLATSRSLTGDHVHKRSRVLIVSLEDDRDELRRRIRAARLHHGISQAEIKGWLFYCTPQPGIRLAELTQEGSPAVGRLDELIRDAIQRRKIDVVALDPLVKAHGLSENDNSAMDFVAGLLANIARDMKVAADVAHHTRKGVPEAGSADAGRGAGAIKDAARLVYTVVKMTPQEAQLFGISERERLLYVRMDSAKVNLSPPSAEARWFKLIGVNLGNGGGDYPHGDNVQTCEIWLPPDAWAGLGYPLLNEILDAIAKGLPDGRRYSAAPRATDTAAWQVVQEFAPDKSPEQAREVIKGWVKSGLLVQEPYHNPIRREDAQGLKVIDAKRPGTK